MEDLHPQLVEVLEAMTRPDPKRPTMLDSPAEALARRMPGVGAVGAANLLYVTNAMGLTVVPQILGLVAPDWTADPTRWITVEGWRAMGTTRKPGRSREN